MKKEYKQKKRSLPGKVKKASKLQHTDKIVLLGYMASGKSTVGRELAEVLNYQFIDLDDYISERENISIPELFSNKGEDFFRKKEFQYLKEILDKKERAVIALGGGTPEYNSAMGLINTKAVSIYLKAHVKTLYNRLAPETTERPLLTHISREFLQEYISSHLFRREKSYNKAIFLICVDDLKVNEIVENIKNIIFSFT